MFSSLITVIWLLSPVYSSTNLVQPIANVRTSVKADTQRVVFDIAGKNEPQYYVKKDKNVLSLTIEANLTPAKEKEIKKILENTKYITSVQFLNLPDEGEVIISMSLKDKTYEEILTLPNPSRVVVDLNKNKTGE